MSSFTIVSDSEWSSIQQEDAGHLDVAEVIAHLASAQPGQTVKIKCPAALHHRKRQTARAQAERRGFRVNTKFHGEWLYIRRRVSDGSTGNNCPSERSNVHL